MCTVRQMIKVAAFVLRNEAKCPNWKRKQLQADFREQIHCFSWIIQTLRSILLSPVNSSYSVYFSLVFHISFFLLVVWFSAVGFGFGCNFIFGAMRTSIQFECQLTY